MTTGEEPGVPQPVELLFSLFSRFKDEKKVAKEVRSHPALLEQLLDRKRVIGLAEGMVRTAVPQRGRRVLDLARALGCQLKQNAYECTAHQLAELKLWHLVPSIVTLGKQHTSKTTVRLLNWRARALVELQHYAALRSMLGEFDQYSLKPNKRTFHLLITGAVRNRDLTQVKELMRQMDEAGVPPDASTHSLIAINYRSFGPNAAVQAHALQNLGKTGGNTATALLNSLVQLRLDARDMPGARAILSFFDKNRIVPIIASVYGADSIQGEGDRSPSPARIIPIDPDANTFSIFINYMAMRHDINGALSLLKGMAAVGVKPTAGTVSSLIHVYFATGDGSSAVHLVAAMCPEISKELFSPFVRAEPPSSLPPIGPETAPTIKVFNALLKGLLHTHGLECTMHVFRIMNDRDVRPNTVTLEILISHLSKVERAPPRTLFRILRNLSVPNLRPTLRHLHVILSSILRHERYLLFGQGWNAISAPFSPKRQFEPRIVPTERLSDTTPAFDPMAGIELPRTPSYRSLIRPIVRSLSARGVRSDTVLLGLRIKRDAALKVDLETAQAVFQTLLARGMQPNEYHFAALMEGMTRAGDFPGAIRILNSATTAGVQPNIVMFTILIVGYARHGNPELAVRTFQDMIRAGIKPDVPSIDAVTSAFFAVGAYSTARRSLIALWPYIQPFPEELAAASLLQLARHFRSIPTPGREGSPKAFSGKERSTLYRKVHGLMLAWKLSNRSPTPWSRKDRETVTRLLSVSKDKRPIYLCVN